MNEAQTKALAKLDQAETALMLARSALFLALPDDEKARAKVYKTLEKITRAQDEVLNLIESVKKL